MLNQATCFCQDKISFEGDVIENLSSQFGLHQVIKEPTHVLDTSSLSLNFYARAKFDNSVRSSFVSTFKLSSSDSWRQPTDEVSGFHPLAVSGRFPSWMFGRFLNASLKLTLMTLYYQYYHLFFLLGAPLNICEEVFCGNGWQVSVTSYFQEKAPY